MKDPLALVLSGGSVRAAAHVGVLKALEKYNLHPDLVVGTSGGSIVAALYAAGMKVSDLERLFIDFTNRKSDVVDLNWPGFIFGLLTLDVSKVSGVVRGKSLEQLIEAHLIKAKKFSELTDTQLLIPTVNLNTGQQTIFCDYAALQIPVENGEYANFQVRDHLTIAQAVRASISIPGVFVPAVFDNDADGDAYVDGGVRNGYPLTVAVKLGQARQVIGVNLGYAGMRREDVIASGPFEILSQSLDIMMRGQYRDVLNDRDIRRSKIVTINPLIYDIATFEVEYIPEMMERGYEVAVRLLESKGLQAGASRAENKAAFFAKTIGADTFPAQGSSYFQELLHRQIKQIRPPVERKTVFERAYNAAKGLFGVLSNTRDKLGS